MNCIIGEKREKNHVHFVCPLRRNKSFRLLDVSRHLSGQGGESHVRADKETVVPFELNGNMILVKGRINDSGRDYTFILDTAALTVIGKDVANDLGLAEEVEVEMRDSAEGKEDVYLSRLKSFTLGGFKADGISAAVFDLGRIRRMTGVRIDGIRASGTALPPTGWGSQ